MGTTWRAERSDGGDPTLLGAPWLERDGYAAHAHQVAAGHRNLSLLGTDPRLA
ncbi:hypothetical protein [Salinispora sp. H7-4]|uniref:hypothetical protein n=1 Tax=Salinispora sp. H7-4 TaxID=2748321 RepID=UPI0015D32C3E|nr:hypothetical protein [Salinispora sp. H7-4]NYT94963.1 hypothetical protein [Salinispora sp. H7-4]